MSSTTTRERPQMQSPVTAQMTAEDRRALAKLPAREAGGVKVAAFFETQKAGLANLLPSHMKPDRFLRIVLNAMRVTPKLMDCTLESLFGATIFCAQVGLEPNTPQGHVYLIPFKNNRQNRTEVQVIIGYQGLIALARRTGEIASISAQAVYANDDFEIDYMNPEDCRHRPLMTGDRGEIIGAWAKATFKDGGMAFDFMPRADIDKIRNGSQGYQTAIKFNSKNSPWIGHYPEMAVKTAIRRLTKRLPMSIEMAAAVALDERDDRRASQGLHTMYERALTNGDGFDMAAVASDAGEDEGAGDEPAPQVQKPEEEKRPEPEAKQRATRQTKPKDAPPPAETQGKQEQDDDPGPQQDRDAPDHDPVTGEIIDGQAEEADPADQGEAAPSDDFRFGG